MTNILFILFLGNGENIKIWNENTKSKFLNYKNNRKLETTLNMDYYDINNDISLILDPIIDGRNNEIKSLIDGINNNSINFFLFL
jgi:hypothetical protein